MTAEHVSTLNWDALWDGERYRAQTRKGGEVRIYTLNGAHPTHPIVGERLAAYGWEPTQWRLDGSYYNSRTSPLDLIPEPRTVRRWVNVYRAPAGGMERMLSYPTIEDAKKYKGCGESFFVKNDKFVKTIYVEWQE